MNTRTAWHFAAIALTTFAQMSAFGAETLASLQLEELSYISKVSPFPKTPILPIDPISHEKADRVLVGPAFKVRGNGSGFDYYRYVTFYDINVRKDRIYELPIHREECHDRSEVFASYAYSYSYSATITASASFEGLGLDSSITEARTFTTSRNLRSTGEIVAEHTPFFLKQNWEGRTFIQMLDSKTGKTEFVTEETKESSWWVAVFIPGIARSKYPMDFSVKNADWTFRVERIFIGPCDRGFAS